MSQQINLFNPAFRRKRVALSSLSLAGALALVVVVLSAVGGYRHQQVKGIEQELASAQGTLKAVQAYSDRLKRDVTARKGDDGAAAEIARLEADLKYARLNLEALSGGALGEQQGFAEYFRAFSRQSLNGLWLTGFSIGGGRIALQGRAVQADLVPAYIQRLNREDVLKGRTFSSLEMHQPKQDTAEAKEATATKGAKTAKPAPAFLEFSMGTGDLAQAAAVAAGATAPSHAPGVTFTPPKPEKQP